MPYKFNKYILDQLLIWIAIIAIIGLAVGYYYSIGYDNSTILSLGSTNKITPEKGQFGDSFGGLTSLLSILTIIIVLITSYAQFKSMQKQIKSQQQQNLENTFFKLVELHNGIIDSIYDIFEENKNSHILYDKKKPKDEFELYSMKSDIYTQRTLVNYDKFYKTNESSIGHYFRNSYHILKFIDERLEDKKFYANIYRVQFSSLELEFLFFNCINSNSEENFKLLVEKYEFFESLNIDKDYLIEDIDKYDKSVFGDNQISLKMIEQISEVSKNDKA